MHDGIRQKEPSVIPSIGPGSIRHGRAFPPPPSGNGSNQDVGLFVSMSNARLHSPPTMDA